MANLYTNEIRSLTSIMDSLNLISEREGGVLALSDIGLTDTNGENAGTLVYNAAQDIECWMWEAPPNEEPTPSDKLIDLLNEQLRKSMPSSPLGYMASAIDDFQVNVTEGGPDGEQVTGQLSVALRKAD